MAPGLNGNGGGSRQTGTVPKTNTYNESARGSTRTDIQNHSRMPNNCERPIKKELCSSTERATSQALQGKTQQLQEARLKLHKLQSLLQTVEELRGSGQPIPESILQLMASHTPDHTSSPTQPDVLDLPIQDLSVSYPISERLTNSCDQSEVFGERLFNSSGSEHSLQQPAKHNNQEGKLGTKLQLEELLRNQDPIFLHASSQGSSFQEDNSNNDVWGSSTQNTIDESFINDFSGDLNESTCVKNEASSIHPQSSWRKSSSGTESSRSSWVLPPIMKGTRKDYQDRSPWHHSTQTYIPADINTSNSPQPDTHWIVHQINQLQNQLQQMSRLYRSFVEKQQNYAQPSIPQPPWVPPPNISNTLGPYCQYIASANEWQQQQQLLMHSLNQSCSLIWHQQRELAALKEALRLLQQLPHCSGEAPVEAVYRAARSHSLLKPSLSAEPTQAPPTVVSSAHSLPNLSTPQACPISPTPVSNRLNMLSPPVSLPPTLNNHLGTQNINPFFNHNSPFPDTNYINHYPPYGNNLNFEFPSPLNLFPNPPEPYISWSSSQPQSATMLNNQVPPGNRANNYWDNFRSYSRQNLLSGNNNSGKSNEEHPQPRRTPVERSFNTDALTNEHALRSKKEGLNVPSPVTADILSSELLTRPQVRQSEPNNHREGVEESVGSSYCSLPPSDTKTSTARHLSNSPQSFHRNIYSECEDRGQHCTRIVNETDPRSISSVQYNENDNRPLQQVNQTDEQPPRHLNENGLHSAWLVNVCEAPQGRNKKLDTSMNSQHKVPVNKKNYTGLPTREAKVIQLNNYNAESADMKNDVDSSLAQVNLVNAEVSSKPVRNLSTVVCNIDNVLQSCIEDGDCTTTNNGVRKKDNSTKDCKPDVGGVLEESVYSEVAALISVNEWRPQFLLQLFKDLRQLSSCSDPGVQAALSSIHSLAKRTYQEDHHNDIQEDEINNKILDSNADKGTLGGLPTHSSLDEPPPQLLQEKEEDEEEEEVEGGAVGGVIEELPKQPPLLANDIHCCKSENVSETDLAEADQSQHILNNRGEVPRNMTRSNNQLEEEVNGYEYSNIDYKNNISMEIKTEGNWAVQQGQESAVDQILTRLHNTSSNSELDISGHFVYNNDSELF